jgi:hypothetical protein
MVECPDVVVGWGPESGYVAVCVRYEGSLYITLPTLMMHGQTQIKFIIHQLSKV